MLINLLSLSWLNLGLFLCEGRALKIDENQTNQLFDIFFNAFETLLDTNAPLKKLTNKEVKIHLKPWLTNGIMISISLSDKKISYIKNFQELRIAR